MLRVLNPITRFFFGRGSSTNQVRVLKIPVFFHAPRDFLRSFCGD